MLIHLSTTTLLRALLVVAGAVALYFLTDIVLIFLLSLLFAALIDPFADRFSRLKINRAFAVIIVYLGTIGVVSALFFIVMPTLRTQIAQLYEAYGASIEQFADANPLIGSILHGDVFSLNANEALTAFQESGISGNINDLVAIASSTFGILLGILLVFVLTFYLVVEEKRLREGIAKILPNEQRNFFELVIPKVKKKTGQWLRGQLIIMFTVGLITYLVLEFVLNLPFALVLGVLAGLLEVIPFLGPMLSAVPSTIIAFAISPIHGVLTMVAYFVIQQIEGQILTPKIMARVAGINPVYSILAVIAGFELFGPVGAVLAIPLAVIFGLVLMEWLEFRKKNTYAKNAS